jgi:hypothetical protein
MLNETDKPVVAYRIEKGSDVGIHDPAHLRANYPERESVQRIMLASPWSKAVRKAHEILLIDRM